MTVEQYGVAIRAAYEAGYLDGLYHPSERRAIERMRECSAGFWTRVLAGLRDKMRPERASSLISGVAAPSRSIPTTCAVSTYTVMAPEPRAR